MRSGILQRHCASEARSVEWKPKLPRKSGAGQLPAITRIGEGLFRKITLCFLCPGNSGGVAHSLWTAGSPQMRYRPLEIAALRASKARVFVLTAGNLRGIEIAAVFLTALSRICKVLHSLPGPFVAPVSQSGHIVIT